MRMLKFPSESVFVWKREEKVGVRYARLGLGLDGSPFYKGGG